MTKMNDTSNDTLFARIVVDQKFCTETELKHCQVEFKKRLKDDPATLEKLLLDFGFITSTQVKRVKQSISETRAASHQIPGYKILGKLGAGAMAVVYKARQLSLDRTVAVKILPKRFSENSDYVARFYKEGKAAAKLNHNNIVQAIDVGEAGGYHYFVMEYVEGKTIYDDLAKGKIYSEDEVLGIVLQVGQALSHAHSKGLIHRDVKPKNIMINTANITKLADMGLARETSDIQAAKNEAGKAFGTPYYIAPEQIRGELDIDGRADVYSLGCTLYHMVTGRVPFQADNPSDVMRKHLKEPLTPPDHINTTLSTGISEIVEVAMAKDRNERYSSIDEMMEDLESIQQGQPPLRARKRFDISSLGDLSNGDTIDDYDHELEELEQQMLSKYKIGLVAMGAIIAVLILIIIFMMLSKGNPS